MGNICSLLKCVTIFNNYEDWSTVCNGPKNKLNKWIGDIPLDNFKGMEKIKDLDYEKLMIRLIRGNIYDHQTVDEVIGNMRGRRPRLIRVSKCLDMQELNMYDRLQFLSIVYPRISRLEHGTTNGFHGFINLQKTKRFVFQKETSGSLDPFKDKVKHETEKKIMIFNHNTKSPEYKTHNEYKRISWDLGGITSVNVEHIMGWVGMRSEKITNYNIDEKVTIILKSLELNPEIHGWGLKKFIQSILESYKYIPYDGIDFYWHIYESPDNCHLIRNGNIPDLIKTEEDQEIFLKAINSISNFKETPLTHMEIFGDVRGNHKLVDYYDTVKDTNVYDTDKSIMLRNFYNEYTVVGNLSWVNSNINVKNINYEYKIPSKYDYKSF